MSLDLRKQRTNNSILGSIGDSVNAREKTCPAELGKNFNKNGSLEILEKKSPPTKKKKRFYPFGALCYADR
jgi:hypothetical protein